MVKLELPPRRDDLRSAGPPHSRAETIRKKRRLSRTLSIYIGSEILKVSGLVFLVLEVVHGSVFTIQAIREYGFDLFMILPLFWQTFAYALYHSIPISLLFGTSLVFGRLIADREIVAMRGFGISSVQLLAAPLILGLAFTFSAYFINGYLVPEIRYAKRNLGQVFLDKLDYLGQGWNKQIQLGKKTTIHISRYSNQQLFDISIFTESTDNLGLGGLLRDSAEESGELTPGSRETLEGVLSIPFIVHARYGEIRRSEPGSDGGSGLELVLENVSFLVDNTYLSQADIDPMGGPEEARPAADLPEEIPGPEEAKLRPLSEHHFLRVTLERLPIRPRSSQKARGHKDMPNPMIREEIAIRREKYRELVASAEPTAADFPDPAALSEARETRLLAIRRAKHGYLSADSDYHRRLSYAGICFFFPLTTTLLALLLNSGNRLLPFFIGVSVCCAVFFPLELQGRNLAKAVGGSWFLAELGNLALVGISIFALLRLENRFPFRRRRGPRGRKREADS